MRLNILAFLLSLLLNTNAHSQKTPFDFNWRFHRGGAQGAEVPGFDDSKWRVVDLPHDWSIEDLPGKYTPFDPDAIGQVSTGFTTGGTAWYRKNFIVSAAEKSKRIIIRFDGVYMNSDIWVNGTFAGNHPYGYTGFWYDITDKIKFGENNVLAVRVKNEGQNSRWYSGSGIYRHVWLTIQDPLHLQTWGTYITTPDISSARATVNIKSTIVNSTNKPASVKLVTRILNASGTEVTRETTEQLVDRDSSYELNQSAMVSNPLTWSVDSPNLYKAISEFYSGNIMVDRYETSFGIRSISFDVSNGFMLNGKRVKLKGGCVHHDNGPLGSKAFDRSEERRIELLKAAGFNAIRCSHNPPSPAFLDACDRLGMLVMDEAFDMWRLPNNPHDYHLYFDEWWKRDIESMVFRDRNHPSIILWSIGNEIREMESKPVIAVEKMLADHIRKIEPTRYVTAAVNNLRPQKDEFFSNLDICGYNYAAGGDHGQKSIYEQDHERVPSRIMFGTESYALETFDAWESVAEHPWILGDFVWTAFDYIGEASIGWRGYWQESNFYPWNLAYCGDIDICGWRRPQSYYREVLWRENKISLFVKPPHPTFPLNPNKQSWSKWEWHDVVADWNWKGYEGEPLEVSVYSSCEEAELFLNEKSFGKKKTDRSSEFKATWQVPYQPGELKVIGYSKGNEINSSRLQTSSNTSKIRFTVDRPVIKADAQDLCYATIEITDSKNIRNPKADNLLKFSISGPGTIVGVGNANPMSLESYQLPQRKAWQGKALVVVKSSGVPGDIILTATSSGLPTSKVIIRSIK